MTKYMVRVAYQEEYEFSDVSSAKEAGDIARSCVVDNHGQAFADQAKFYVTNMTEDNTIPQYGDMSDAGMDGA
jgi:hypothetical protein